MFNPVFPPINFPDFIGNLNSSTIPFETRFVRNLIDGDITLPANMVKDLDEGMWSLNGRALTITGLQFGDAIRFAAGSGFTFEFGPSGIKLNGQAFATASGNSTTATFTFVTNVTATQLEQMLEALTFQAGPANPAQTSRTLSFTVNTPTQLTGSVALSLAAPQEQNQIQDLDNQTVLITDNSVRLDSAITLSDEFIAAYSSAGSLNNSTVSVTGWIGQTAPIRFASDTGVSVSRLNDILDGISVDGVQVGTYNRFIGTISLGPSATAETIERLIEAISIDPQLTTQTPTRTMTVTVVTPTLPQHGTVTFTGTTVLLNDLRETVDVSYLDASGTGVHLDPDVTLVGNGPWTNGQVEVTGLLAGDILSVVPDVSGFFFDVGTGAVSVSRNASLIEVANVTARTDTGLTFTLNGNATRADIETLIESLHFSTQTSGLRNIQISVSDQSGSRATGSIALDVGYIPTLTEMVNQLDLTAAEAEAGTLLDADVTFKGDESFDGAGITISGLGEGDSITLRTGDGSPITIEATEDGTNILIGDDVVGTMYRYPTNIQIVGNEGTTAADIEAILENLVFRTTNMVATRDITIQIADQNGDFDKQGITVNILPPGAKEMSYQILTFENDTLVPMDGASGKTGDLDPSDLFGPGQMPDEFVVEYSGVLNVGAVGFAERTILAFSDINDETTVVVDGVAYTITGPEGRLILDLAPGLHKISLSVYYSPFGEDISAPTITVGTAVPPADGEAWPDYIQSPLFDTVQTVPETLHRVTVTSTTTMPGGEPTVHTDVFYVTSLDDVPTQIQALRQKFNLPPQVTFEQTYTTVTETLGSAGADTLVGTVGNDLLDGGAGDDTLLGSLGADTLDGGTGVNTVSYEASDAGVTVDLSKGVGQGGHAEGDVLRNIQAVLGSAFGDHLVGSAGNDTLFGGGGRDSVVGGAGDDALIGGLGNDSLEGGAGNDILRGGLGADRLFGGDGDDLLRGGAGADRIDGGAGTNRVSYIDSDAAVTVDLEGGQNLGGHAAGDRLFNIQQVVGSAFDDVLIGRNAGADTLFGGAGDDSLDGNAGADRLFGDAGDDTLVGDGGADRLFGGAGNDSLSGGDGNDWLEGGAGADTLDGGRGVDTVSYAAASTGVTVSLADGVASRGDAQGDVITNVERVIGSAFGDDLRGSAGSDTLEGGAGDDQLDGGAGDDLLIGGTGNDVFVFSAGFGSDRIADLDIGDGIVLMPELWGSVQFGDVASLIETYGQQQDGYVELRLTEADILRIDDITLQDLLDLPNYFLLGA